MGKPGSVIQEYIDRTFARFADANPPDSAPLTPWSPMPKAGLDRLREHLTDAYGVAVKKLTPLDCGVLRVDRADGSRWIARVFPPSRSAAAVDGDAAVLSFLARHDFPAERLANDDAVSVVDDHRVIVTEFVDGKAASMNRVIATWIGDALGRLHSLPLDAAPPQLGGGWHSLSLDGGGRAADLAVLAPLLDDLARLVPAADRPHLDKIRGALAALDLCEDLPHALVHVDFGGPNLLKGKDGAFTLIDWTGAGRGPRIASLASVVGPLGPVGIDGVVAAYRGHVEPTAEELDRLEGTLITHRLVLGCWGIVMQPGNVAGLAAGVDRAGPAMKDVAKRVRKAFAA